MIDRGIASLAVVVSEPANTSLEQQLIPRHRARNPSLPDLSTFRFDCDRRAPTIASRQTWSAPQWKIKTQQTLASVDDWNPPAPKWDAPSEPAWGSSTSLRGGKSGKGGKGGKGGKSRGVVKSIVQASAAAE